MACILSFFFLLHSQVTIPLLVPIDDCFRKECISHVGQIGFQ